MINICFFRIGWSLSLQNRTKVHPSEMRYALLWRLHNSILVILGSIIELERCGKKFVQSSGFEKEFGKTLVCLKIECFLPFC